MPCPTILGAIVMPIVYRPTALKITLRSDSRVIILDASTIPIVLRHRIHKEGSLWPGGRLALVSDC